MKKIGLFYGPAKGSTENVAKKVAEQFGSNNVEMVLITENTEPTELDAYTHLVFGISTVGRDSWDANYGKVGWDFFLPKLEDYDFKGKTVAIFGLGNHIMYAENFLDALGQLGPIVTENNGNLVGQMATDFYDEFANIDSLGVVDGLFPGLPIDEDNLSDETDERVAEWVDAIKNKFA